VMAAMLTICSEPEFQGISIYTEKGWRLGFLRNGELAVVLWGRSSRPVHVQVLSPRIGMGWVDVGIAVACLKEVT